MRQAKGEAGQSGTVPATVSRISVRKAASQIPALTVVRFPAGISREPWAVCVAAAARLPL